MRNFKFLVLIAVLFFCVSNGIAQLRLPSYDQSTFPTYYWQRASLFNVLPNKPHGTVFIGDSITDGGEWATLFEDISIINMGISGDVTNGVINRLSSLIRLQPKKVFLLIGINDLARNITVDSTFENIQLIVKYIHQESPTTKVFVQSILPVNDNFKTFPSHTNKTPSILKLNGLLNNTSKVLSYTFVDIHSAFSDKEGKLKADLTNDGLHLKGAGYALWKHIIFSYVYGLQQETSLIPKPASLKPQNGLFPLYKAKSIFYNADGLKAEAVKLQNILADLDVAVSISKVKSTKAEPTIQLLQKQIAKTELISGSYQLKVDTTKIVIESESTTGIFYGIQTLKQLARDGYFLDAVSIEDKPVFAWRGYMVDVGRNYQSVALLKQQIDVMAAYKLNVFHMHLTEDIAWRLAIKAYPQLTEPQFMERNKGMYYTEAEIKDLISYCKERHILFVPEIDMPGHSAAFKRAMKVEMQSDSGLTIVKNILREIVQTYDLPYIHIGADEVKITNKSFLPEVSALLKSLNRKVIGWEPGGNFAESTIRQLWMDDAAISSGNTNIHYIDSRHLYLNHMDPLESVVTIFNRQLAGVDHGNDQALGATLCLWPDRAVAKEEDAINMNGVYPAMLAFAERTWRGGGYKGWLAGANLNGDEAFVQFTNFENRLIDHKNLYFKNLSFPYVKQSGITWRLFGPFENQGNLATKFKPEEALFNLEKEKPNAMATGGTVILRHWWAPKINGVLKNPAQNTTWYAVRKIWSEKDTIGNFWIGFNNFSRSQAVDSPQQGTWDNHHSEVWLNGTLVEPPEWLHAGQKGNLEIPLADEGYEYRTPTALNLKRGWNTFMIKAPIGSFVAKNWNNPEKWMFTLVELEP